MPSTTACDWVAKHQLIEEYRLVTELALDHPKVAMIDLLYHDIDRSRGLYYRLERAGQVAGSPPTNHRQAKPSPPQTTRARLRGAFVRTAKERRRDFTVDWVHLKLNDQAQRTVILKDPSVSHDERVERLIASL